MVPVMEVGTGAVEGKIVEILMAVALETRLTIVMPVATEWRWGVPRSDGVVECSLATRTSVDVERAPIDVRVDDCEEGGSRVAAVMTRMASGAQQMFEIRTAVPDDTGGGCCGDWALWTWSAWRACAVSDVVIHSTSARVLWRLLGPLGGVAC